MRVGNSPDLRGSEKGGGRERIDEREIKRIAERARKREIERGKEKGETKVRQRRRLRESICIYGRYIARLAEGTS